MTFSLKIKLLHIDNYFFNDDIILSFYALLLNFNIAIAYRQLSSSGSNYYAIILHV